MKISRKLLIPVVTIVTSAVTPAAALAATSSPIVTFRPGTPAQTVSLGSTTQQLQRAAAEVVTGFQMPSAASGHLAGTSETSVPGGASPEIVPIGTIPSDAVGSEFSNCVSEPHDGLCMWQNVGYKGDFWYYDQKGYAHDVWEYVGGRVNDLASSIYNMRTEGTLVGKNMPPSMPDIVCIIHQAAYGNLTAYAWPDGSTMNDSISSFNFVSSPNC
jgi:hypothetical protein